MRLLNVIRSTSTKCGGPVEWLAQLSSELSFRGHTIDTASLDAPDTTHDNPELLKLYSLGPGIGKYGFSTRYIPWLKNNISRYDAVLVHGLWQYHSWATWMTLRNTGKPYFIYPHGMLDSYFKYAHPIKHLKKRFYWPLTEFKVLRDASSVIFTSADEMIASKDCFSPYKCRENLAHLGIAHPPIDKISKALFFKQYPSLSGKKILLFMGRLVPKKGCDLVIKAFARVNIQSNDYRIVFAGHDEVGWKHRLEKLSEKLKIHDKIVWVGMLSGESKWAAFKAADAFILPSHQENFGMSVVEALGCSLPVLISNKVNICRAVSQDKAGIVAQDNCDGVVELIEKWASLSENKKNVMRVNAKYCFNRFEINKAADKLMSVLNTFLIREK